MGGGWTAEKAIHRPLTLTSWRNTSPPDPRRLLTPEILGGLGVRCGQQGKKGTDGGAQKPGSWNRWGSKPSELMKRIKLSAFLGNGEISGIRVVVTVDGQIYSPLPKETSPWRKNRVKDLPSFDRTKTCITETHQRANS